MELLKNTLVLLVAIEHLYILWVEMFAWETAGKKAFGNSLPAHLFTPTKKLAANQGLYNGFLAAGLIWSLLITDPLWSRHVATFFLGCIIVAAVYGAVTASKRILVLQGLPAIIALGVLMLL
ncbi:DUF1304 domain-containing protein [Parapedobacter koreensis]|uniref:Putative membrane protein n=1 Tax=Parapedobacter koreensis TaxID=332977 RepID=A0A1H7J9R5_9SPHI|nr:DUF1304 domain-containing protein [Parapedobacter koreensis]SEK71388.1 putative membrane protein [Parapedobacter koreensis]